MKRYSVFHPLILSFFSKSLYRDVGKNWRGTGLLYLLFVLVLIWIPTMIKGYLGLARFTDKEATEITQQIPPITITNGHASTNVPLPHYIKIPKTGETLAIIDTRDNSEASNRSVPIVLTETKVVTNRGASETRIYDLSGVQSFFVDQTRVESWLSIARRWFFPVVYPLAVLFSFIFRAVQILIYALIGLLFARMLNANLDYKTLMRLAAISITPVLVLNLLFEFVPVRIPGWFLLGIIIELAYLFFAVKVNSEPDIPQYQPPPAYPTTMS
jgi:hypothetical protein